MSNFKLVKLHFYEPLILATGRDDYADISETLHSDTIKSALFASALQLFNNINENFFNQFRISSAFPYVEDRLFFPKPFLKLPLKIQDEEKSEAKKLKKLQWIEQALFEKIIQAEDTSVYNANFSPNGKFLLSTTNNAAFSAYTIEEQNRVKIKYYDDNEPFYVSRLKFTENAGFFVLLQTNNDDFFESTLKPAFFFLGDNGIGSYKTTGNGFFTPEFSTIELNVPKESIYTLNLSLYCPKKDELNNSILENSSYQLIKTGGYLAAAQPLEKRHWRKKSVFMFQEGSVFYAQNLSGKLADLTPDGFTQHKIWRDGQALFIPVIKNNEK